MDPLAGAAALSVMVAVFLGAMALYYGGTLTAGRLTRHRLSVLFGGVAPAQTVDGSALRQQSAGALSGLDALVSGKEWASKAALDLDRADLHLRVGEYLGIRVGAALVLAALAFVLVRAQPAAFLLAVVSLAVGYMLPAFWVGRRKTKRVVKLNTQLEEALTLTANSLKAGFGLLQSLELAAEQLEHPISTELRRTVRDINIGSAMEDSLMALSQRAGSYDLDIVVTAIMIQRSVGGNLAEILDTVAHTMRERGRIRGEIRVLTAQQRYTGYVLGGLPLFIMGILFILSREYMEPLFTTLAGQAMLAGAAVLEIVGVLLIRRILAIEV